MPQKLFKIIPPPEIIWELLDNITYIDNKNYIINYEAYKKMIYEELQDYLFDNLLEYYNEKHYFYIDKELNYKRFLTIIKQVCRENSIPCIYYTASLSCNNILLVGSQQYNSL